MELRGTATHASSASTKILRFQGNATTIKAVSTVQLKGQGQGKHVSSLHAHPRVEGGGLVHAHNLNNQAAQRAGLATTSSVGADVAQVSAAQGKPAPGELLSKFAGLNSVDNFNANGFILEPPDQGLCVGNLLGQKVVAEVINDVVAFYTPTGKIVAGPANLNVLFAEPATEGMSDPRCVFDPSTQTFFFTVLAIAPTANALPTHDDLLVLHASGTANVYRADTTFATDTAGQCPCFGDQPKVGLDKYNVYISTDEFGGPGQSLETGAAVIAFSKAQLVLGQPTVDAATFLNLSIGGIGVVGLQPAISDGTATQEFLLNAFPYADEAQLHPNSLSRSLGLWAISNPQVVSQGGVPSLVEMTITSEVYGFPVPALSTNKLSLATFTNDSRMQQVQYINGHLVAALDSAIAVGGDPITRDGAAWFEMKPHLTHDNDLDGVDFIKQGYVAVAGEYLLYPAIIQANTGATGISFSVTSPTINPSTGYVTLAPNSGNFSKLHITANGSGPDIGFTCALGSPQQCRWGDYGWAALDPNGVDMWMATEDTVNHVATQPNTNPAAQTNWGTEVWEVNGD